MNCPFFADIKEKRKKNNFTQIMSHWSPCGHLEFESSAFAFDFNHSTAWNFKTNKRKSRWFKVIHSTLEIFFYSSETSFDHFWLTTAIWYINAQNSIELSYISILTWHSTTSEEDVFLKFLKFWILIFCRFFFVLTFVLIFWLRNCWDVKNVYTSRNLIKTNRIFLVKLQSENIELNGCPWYQKSEFSSQIAWQAQIDAHWLENTSFWRKKLDKTLKLLNAL